jgi:hypothetical protein
MPHFPQVNVLDPSAAISNLDCTIAGSWIKHQAVSQSQEAESPLPRVRLLMPLVDASRLADMLSSSIGGADEQRILDQLWLRTTLVEQWRRTRIVDRRTFQERADRALSALDP